MNHTKKKKNGVPDKASGTPLRSVCGILCGQQKYEKEYRTKKLLKTKENTQNQKILGVILELLSGFEPETSSLPNIGHMFSSLVAYRNLLFLFLALQRIHALPVVSYCTLPPCLRCGFLVMVAVFVAVSIFKLIVCIFYLSESTKITDVAKNGLRISP